MLVSLLLSWLLAAEPAQQTCKVHCNAQATAAAAHDECPLSSCDDGAPRSPGTARVPSAILSFEASWCAPCQQMRSVLARLKESGIAVRHVDVDQQPALVAKYRVRNIPAYVAVVGERELNRCEGACSFDHLVRLTKSAGPPAPPAASPNVLAPGAEQSEMLIRATYELCPEKAQALASFLDDFASETVELRHADGRLTVTAAPEVQRAVGQFISLLLKDTGAQVAASSACTGWIAHLADVCQSAGIDSAQFCPAINAVSAMATAATCRHNCSPDCTNACAGECTAACSPARTGAIDHLRWNFTPAAPFGMPAIAPAVPIHAHPPHPFAAALPPGLPLPPHQIRPPAIHHVVHTDRPLTLVLEADLELLEEVNRFIETKTKQRAAKQAQHSEPTAPFILGIKH